jgi:PAS domain S-box-containing protein
MNKPSYQELEARIRELERESSERKRIETELLEKQSILREQNISLVRKSIELSDIKRELEDKNYELESIRSELRNQNVNLVRKSIELSDMMRQLEDRNYDLELIRSELRKQNINLVRRSIELSDMMRQFEDKNYDLELSQTDLEKALAALRQSEERYRQLVENANDIIYGTDDSGHLSFVNPVAERIMGYSEQEFIGRHYLDLIRPDHRQDAERFYGLQFVERIPNTYYEFPAVTRDGTELWLGQNVQLVMEDDRVVGFQAVARDITERRRAEEALRRAHDELELRVQERTVELAQANEALQIEIAERVRAEEQIKVSLREKEVLLKEIHHRVKNNLQVISSLLYLQSKSIKDQQSFEILQDSQNRVRSMALVHERLYQSKDLASIDFAEYVRNLVTYLFRAYGVNPNVIKLKIHLGNVLLGVDTAIPCGLIINELVSNSLKHAFPDGREGEICIEFRSDDSQCTLMVGDNGVGFRQDLDFRDTGSLGLQLVDTLVDQLEGTIELNRSGGTAFKITFAEPR